MNQPLTDFILKPAKYLVILLIGVIVGWLVHENQKPRIVDIQNDWQNTENDCVVFEQNSQAEIKSEDTDLLQLLNGLLKRHKFEAAISLYESLQQDNDLDSMDAAKKNIFSFVRQLIAQQNYKQSKKLLSHYLLAFNRDVDARLLMVEVDYRVMNYKMAIDSLYLAKGHAFREDVIEGIVNKTRLIVNKQADVFKNNNQYTELLALYEKLTQLEADYAPFFIGLAEAQILLGNLDAAKSNLQMLLGDVDVGHQASLMLAELQPASIPETFDEEAEEEPETSPGIALFRRGNNYFIDTYPNGDDAIRMLIDTGASLTVLTPAALKKHRVKYKDTGEVRVFSTANGLVEAPIYQLEYLMVGDWRVDDITIAVLKMQNDGSSEGLLGMNFLQHFQFFIDQKNKLLHLSLR